MGKNISYGINIYIYIYTYCSILFNCSTGHGSPKVRGWVGCDLDCERLGKGGQNRDMRNSKYDG